MIFSSPSEPAQENTPGHDQLDFVFGDCNQRTKVRKNVCVGIISDKKVCKFNKKIAVNSNKLFKKGYFFTKYVEDLQFYMRSAGF